MKTRLVASLACLTSSAALHAADASRPSQPNVIFILADDSGFADFGCHGHPDARTPNIDRLDTRT